MDKKPTVLVVDDEADVAKEIAEIIGETGEYEVLSAFSGEKAVETVKKGGVDVVVLDIKMPGMSGMDALKQIRAFDRAVRVIMLTALDEAKFAWDAASYGANDYLTKPFNAQDVLLRIKLNVAERQKHAEEMKKWRLIEHLKDYSDINPEGASKVWALIYSEARLKRLEKFMDLSYAELEKIMKENMEWNDHPAGR